MLLHIPNILSVEQVHTFRQQLDDAAWTDGRVTAGFQSAQAKLNEQLDESSVLANELGATVTQALLANTTFFAGALPRHIYPPLFNRYRGGQHFDFHVDNAIRYNRRSTPALPIRTDLSATLFLSEPDEYEGGELVVEDTFGTHSIKLPAGDLLLYPGTSLHKVLPVTRGARVASFFWIQSLVRDDGHRNTLFNLDLAIQRLSQNQTHDASAILSLTGVYHNLLRYWSDT